MPLFQKHSQEGRLITLEFDKFYLLNLYKPNIGKMLAKYEKR